MDIVKFAEEILGYKLLSFQKEFLTKCYEAYTSNEQLYYIPHRGNIKFDKLSTEEFDIILNSINVANDVICMINKNH